MTEVTPMSDETATQLAYFHVYLARVCANFYTIFTLQDLYFSSKVTHMTPAPWINLIWHPIQWLLYGTAIYQLTSSGHRVIVEGISWRLPALGVINTVYMFIRAYEFHIIAHFFLTMAVTGIVTSIYNEVKKHCNPNSVGDCLLVRLPFSLMSTWLIVLGTTSCFEVFGVDATEHEAGFWTNTFVIMNLLSFELQAVSYAFSTPSDFASTAVLSWTLWAIFANQRSFGLIYWTSFISAILSSFWLLKCFFDIKHAVSSIKG